MNTRVVEQTTSNVEDELEDISGEINQVTQTQRATEKQIPEKFKNKSLDDVITSYTQLESEYGRKANEVGELRRLTDELLGLQLKKEASVEPPKKSITSDDLFENPDQIINDAVNSNPRIKELENQIRADKIQKERDKFESQHADWQSVMGSQDFQDWIRQSPARTRLLVEADKNYDYQTGSELLTLYKEIKQVDIRKKEAEALEKTDSDLKASITERGSTGQTGKKVYRRADLIQLRLRNPAKYSAMEDEIMNAYKEGRVK